MKVADKPTLDAWPLLFTSHGPRAVGGLDVVRRENCPKSMLLSYTMRNSFRNYSSLGEPPTAESSDVVRLEAHWDRVASAVPGEVSVELLSGGRPVASRRSLVRHYAASTIKLAVLAAVLAEVAAGRMNFSDQIGITDTFESRVGSQFTLRQLDDQDDATWLCRGGSLPVDTLVERMVTDSSNIATNVIVQELTFSPVHEMLAVACPGEVTMNRLIGDERAEAKGLTNTVTARGLGRFLWALANGTLLPTNATQHALELLARQKHRQMIPAGIPPGTWSAGKGGWTTAVNHDVALVRPDKAPAYVLSVCATTGLPDAEANDLVAQLSAVTWEHWSQWHKSSE